MFVASLHLTSLYLCFLLYDQPESCEREEGHTTICMPATKILLEHVAVATGYIVKIKRKIRFVLLAASCTGLVAVRWLFK